MLSAVLCSRHIYKLCNNYESETRIIIAMDNIVVLSCVLAIVAIDVSHLKYVSVLIGLTVWMNVVL